MLEAPTTTRILALEWRSDVLQQADDPVGRAGAHQGYALCEAPDVVGMEAIDILDRGDALDDRRLADQLRQRQLHEDPVDLLVVVQVIDERQQPGLCGRLGQIVGE